MRVGTAIYFGTRRSGSAPGQVGAGILMFVEPHVSEVNIGSSPWPVVALLLFSVGGLLISLCGGGEGRRCSLNADQGMGPNTALLTDAFSLLSLGTARQDANVRHRHGAPIGAMTTRGCPFCVRPTRSHSICRQACPGVHPVAAALLSLYNAITPRLVSRARGSRPRRRLWARTSSGAAISSRFCSLSSSVGF